ncbi:MAG TPA: NADH-quinone oxidoreductase subunit L, partial [Jiangellaceae bacterium]|nr:NADH-quinone oxidoreductase subunit L [Jiangellaceae bacterium]
SGFYSKDTIIEAAIGENWVIGVAALIGAGVTAFYMTRLMLMTFMGQKRWDKGVDPHESPSVMTWPLILLAIPSALAGLVLYQFGSGIVDWLAPVTGEEHHDLPLPVIAIQLITLAIVAVGVFVGWRMYGAEVPRTAPRGSVLTRAARADLYGDAVNEALVMRPGQYLTRSLVFTENRGVDGVVRGIARAIAGSSSRVRRWQTGFVRSYALSMLAGTALVVVAMLVVRLP